MKNDTELDGFAEFLIKLLISFFVSVEVLLSGLFFLLFQLFLSKGFKFFFTMLVFEIFFKFLIVNLLPFSNFLDHVENFLGDFLIDDFESF